MRRHRPRHKAGPRSRSASSSDRRLARGPDTLDAQPGRPPVESRRPAGGGRQTAPVQMGVIRRLKRAHARRRTVTNACCSQRLRRSRSIATRSSRCRMTRSRTFAPVIPGRHRRTCAGSATPRPPVEGPSPKWSPTTRRSPASSRSPPRGQVAGNLLALPSTRGLGTKLVQIPYNSPVQAMTDTIGGRTELLGAVDHRRHAVHQSAARSSRSRS